MLVVFDFVVYCMNREMEEVLSRNQQKESQAIVVSNPCVTSQELDLDMVPLKSDLDSSLVKLASSP